MGAAQHATLKERHATKMMKISELLGRGPQGEDPPRIEDAADLAQASFHSWCLHQRMTPIGLWTADMITADEQGHIEDAPGVVYHESREVMIPHETNDRWALCWVKMPAEASASSQIVSTLKAWASERRAKKPLDY